MPSLRDQIFAIDDTQSELVDVPEWNCKIDVRSMNSFERTAAIADATDEEGKVVPLIFTPRIIIATAHDPETGEKVFHPTDVDALNTKSGGVTARLAEVAMRVSGMTKSAQEQLGKGSDAPQTEDSPSS